MSDLVLKTLDAEIARCDRAITDEDGKRGYHQTWADESAKAIAKLKADRAQYVKAKEALLAASKPPKYDFKVGDRVIYKFGSRKATVREAYVGNDGATYVKLVWDVTTDSGGKGSACAYNLEKIVADPGAFYAKSEDFKPGEVAYAPGGVIRVKNFTPPEALTRWAGSTDGYPKVGDRVRVKNCMQQCKGKLTSVYNYWDIRIQWDDGGPWGPGDFHKNLTLGDIEAIG